MTCFVEPKMVIDKWVWWCDACGLGGDGLSEKWVEDSVAEHERACEGPA